MAKDLQTLIRLNEWTVDERRRELGDVLGSLETLESGLTRLGEELVREQQAAQSSPDVAGFLYGSYATAVIDRRYHLNAGIAQMTAKVTEARERLDEAYRELKKYEVAHENRTLKLAKEASRLEQIEMDELGLQAHRMKHR
ncbi:MAG: flagellar export protein FliJ [Alphaproteobacteria bacterium]|jgi:flagellar protein FliJ|nr:flagellar export protein FliJ [Alphaproteobacteria bacterium]MBT7942024.1 flagellar export protein FliJ [Alphaproteobacteria bacterium]